MSDWNEQNDQPALTLAAIRWYAISIEKLSTDLYVTDPSQYPAVQAVLNQAVSALEGLRTQVKSQRAGAGAAVRSTGGNCPPGYRNCDGLCLPACPGGGQY